MLSNFNHERWVMISSAARSQRYIVEECLKFALFFLHPVITLLISVSRWTSQRKAFGKPLHSQAVIRSKLAAMISRVESTQSWLENITYQMNHMVISVDCSLHLDTDLALVI